MPSNRQLVKRGKCVVHALIRTRYMQMQHAGGGDHPKAFHDVVGVDVEKNRHQQGEDKRP